MLGTKQPYSSLAKAAAFYKKPEMKRWVHQRKTLKLPELNYFDRISPFYISMMQMLPPELAAIMNIVLCSYHAGITPKQIAQRRFKSHNSTTSQLHRLKHAGLLKTRRSGKETYYFVDDPDFLGVAAIRWDSRFTPFLQHNRHKPDIVTQFITLMSQGSPTPHI